MSIALVDSSSSASTTSGLPAVSFFASGFTVGGQVRETADSNGADKTCWYFDVAAATDNVIGYQRPGSGAGTGAAIWDGDNDTFAGLTIGDGVYHSIYGVFRGTNSIDLYIDGVLKATGTVGVGNVLPGIMIFGNRTTGSNSRWFQGELADFKAWSVNLTAGQVAAEHAHAAPQVTSNLYGYWPFTNAATAATASQGGHNLTINGSGFVDGAQNPTYSSGATYNSAAFGGGI